MAPGLSEAVAHSLIIEKLSQPLSASKHTSFFDSGMQGSFYLMCTCSHKMQCLQCTQERNLTPSTAAMSSSAGFVLFNRDAKIKCQEDIWRSNTQINTKL